MKFLNFEKRHAEPDMPSFRMLHIRWLDLPYLAICRIWRLWLHPPQRRARSPPKFKMVSSDTNHINLWSL